MREPKFKHNEKVIYKGNKGYIGGIFLVSPQSDFHITEDSLEYNYIITSNPINDHDGREVLNNCVVETSKFLTKFDSKIMKAIEAAKDVLINHGIDF